MQYERVTFSRKQMVYHVILCERNYAQLLNPTVYQTKIKICSIEETLIHLQNRPIF